MGLAFDKVDWATLLHALPLNPFKTCPVKTMSSETFNKLVLSAVTYGDSSTTSQAEVPLEWSHAELQEMGPFKITHCVFLTRPSWLAGFFHFPKLSSKIWQIKTVSFS